MASVTHPGVHIAEGAAARSIEAVETGVPVFIGYGEEAGREAARKAAPPVEVRSFAEHEARFGPARYRLGEALRLFFENGGRRCYVVALRPGDKPAAEDFRAGLAAARDVDDADLVVLPDAALLRADDYGALVREVLKDCARRRRFALLERREGADFGANWLSWGAAYRLRGGEAAGLYAAEDAARGVWRAPAELPGTTLARDGEWKYVIVRRLSIMIERSIERGLQWAAFEPRQPELFALVRGLMKSFLMELWRRGALAGGYPDQAFFVRCDGAMIAQEDLDAGDFIIEVSIAPFKPAEFVVLRIVQRAAR